MKLLMGSIAMAVNYWRSIAVAVNCWRSISGGKFFYSRMIYKDFVQKKVKDVITEEILYMNLVKDDNKICDI